MILSFCLSKKKEIYEAQKLQIQRPNRNGYLLDTDTLQILEDTT